jgi:chromosomal replication initiation ATPase DnaA
MDKDQIIDALRKENGVLWAGRFKQGMPDVTTLFGYQLDQLQAIVRDHELREEARTRPQQTVEDIIKRTCAEMYVEPHQVRSGDRTSIVSDCRHLCMRRLYDLGSEWSTPRVGRVFNRDHTTVLYALRKYPEGS